MADTTTPTPESGIPAKPDRAPQPWVQAALRHDARKLVRNIVLALLGVALIVIGVLLYRHFAHGNPRTMRRLTAISTRLVPVLPAT